MPSTIVVRVVTIVRNAAEPVAQELAERVGIGRAHFDQQAVLARDVMDFENLGDLGDELRRPLVARPLLVAHEDERQKRQADRLRD